jgi:hypothetical protein
MGYKTLYQRLLGDDFDKLPAVLRSFHSLPHGGRALGTVTVRREAGFIRHQAARALRLPPVGEDIPFDYKYCPREMENSGGVTLANIALKRDNGRMALSSLKKPDRSASPSK